MKRLRLKNYQEYLQEKLDKIQKKLIENSSIPEGTKKLLLKIKGYVCDVSCGRAKYKNKYYVVPLWAYDKPKGERYFEYYIAHELAHLSYRYRRGFNSNHDAGFYKNFSEICPIEIQHFEFGYKPRLANQYGLKNK